MVIVEESFWRVRLKMAYCLGSSFGLVVTVFFVFWLMCVRNVFI